MTPVRNDTMNLAMQSWLSEWASAVQTALAAAGASVGQAAVVPRPRPTAAVPRPRRSGVQSSYARP